MPQLTADQKHYLKDKLARLRNTKHVFYGSRPVQIAKTPDIVSAEKEIKLLGKIVARYDKACEKATKKRDARRRAMFELCLREIANGDYKKALAAVDKLDATDFD